MVEIAGRTIEHPPRLALDRAFVGFLVRPGLDLLRKERSRALELRLGIVDVVRHIDQHVPDRLAQARTGKDVVADDGEAFAGEAFADDPKNRLTNGLGNPRIDAVREDGVEAAEGLVHIDEIAHMKADVGAAAALRGHAGAGDRLLGQIDPDKFRLRRAERHIDEIDALAAADFEHARGFERPETTTEQSGEHADRGRMDHGEGQAGVTHAIVSVQAKALPVSTRLRPIGQEFTPAGKVNSPFRRDRPAPRRPTAVHDFCGVPSMRHWVSAGLSAGPLRPSTGPP